MFIYLQLQKKDTNNNFRSASVNARGKNLLSW